MKKILGTNKDFKFVSMVIMKTRNLWSTVCQRTLDLSVQTVWDGGLN